MHNINDDTQYSNDDKAGLLSLNSQNKLIIAGSLISSILIMLTAWIVINNTQEKILDSYKNFGSMLAKTLAIQGVDLVSNTYHRKKEYKKIKAYTDLVIKNNKDISYIIFKDKKGNVLYSTTEKAGSIEVVEPIVSEVGKSIKVIGSIQVGLTGNTMNIVKKASRNLMTLIFTVAWILSIAAVLINTLLISRQIRLLVEGVRKVSTGEFGYKISSKDLWGEIKQLFDAFNDMSVRLRQYEDKNIDQLTYERNKLEAVLMSIANGVIVCDNYDKIILVNNAALKMLDSSAKKLINSRIIDYSDIAGDLCFQGEIDKFKASPLEEIESKPLIFHTKIDDRIVQTIISPIFTMNEEYLGYILVLHDITKEAEIDAMKNNFISNVSHELRTPVTILRSYADTLYNYKNEFDEKTKEEFIGIINQEVERLDKMVNDILDFSRLESPDIELEKTLTEVGSIVEFTVNSMKILAQEKNLLFSLKMDPELPKVMINPESIERAFKNLLSNAIKYSYADTKVEIKVEFDSVGNYLQVSIQDSGIGIAEKNLPKIFDRFFRVENKTHTIKGTGLGLHLVKMTIEKHHRGQVFVESKINEGSTFGFRIPLQ